MKKILFVCMGLGIGGTEKTLVEAINALDKSKYDITLYIRKQRTVLVSELNSGVHIVVNDKAPLEEKRIYSRICGVAAKLSRPINKNIEHRFTRAQRKYILKKRVEYEAKTFFSDSVVYDYAVAYDMAQECVRFVSKVVNAKKKIAFFHSSTLTPSKAGLYQSFDTIVGVNSCVSQIIREGYPKLSEKTTYIENYLDPNSIIGMAKKANVVNRPKSDLVLCSCGRITSEKGFDLAVLAANVLKKYGMSFHWFFVGGGKDEEKTRKLISKNGLSESITVTGFIDNPYGYINICDIYVQPSYEEAHATTMVESRILCKPMVSTNTASGRFFKDTYDCCVLTDVTPDSLAEGIIRLWKDKKLFTRITENEKSINDSNIKKEYISKMNALFEG